MVQSHQILCNTCVYAFYFNFSVYSGHQSLLIAPNELEVNSQLWLHALCQYKVRTVCLSYGAIELSTRDIAAQLASLKVIILVT